jgi:hypothetical protein
MSSDNLPYGRIADRLPSEPPKKRNGANSLDFFAVNGINSSYISDDFGKSVSLAFFYNETKL